MDTLVLVIAVLMCLLINDAFTEEPKCSRFDYDEKMMEKMVRNEIRMEELIKRLDLNDAVLGDLRTEFRNSTQSTRDDYLMNLNEFIQKRFGNTTVHGGWSDWSSWGSCSVTCDVGLERRDRTCTNPKPLLFGDHCYGDSHEDRICTNTSCRSDVAKIAFSAKLGSTISHTTSGQTIVFDTITVNHANGYSPSTGIFTAPQNGTYQFSFSILFYAPSSGGTTCEIYLMKGSTGVVYSHSDTHSGKNGYSQSGVNYIIDLMNDEHVYVKSGSAGCYINPSHYTFFSGFFLF